MLPTILPQDAGRLKESSNPCAKIDYIRDDLTKIGIMNSGNNKQRYGYDAILIARPDFTTSYCPGCPQIAFIGQARCPFPPVPRRCQVVCQDNLDGITGSEATVIYKDGILIGADGAYSAIGGGLYDDMTEQGIQLPAEDLGGLRFDSNWVIGTTEHLSYEEYPALKKTIGRLSCHSRPRARYSSRLMVHTSQNVYAVRIQAIYDDSRITYSVCGQRAELLLLWSDGYSSSMMRKIFGFVLGKCTFTLPRPEIYQ